METWRGELNVTVALLAEGVGRNENKNISAVTTMVALLAEGVGRNWSDCCRCCV